MKHSLFISDLHLCESRPHIIDAFVSFLDNIAVHADSLYILGDLFEYWAGDDAVEEAGTHKLSIDALSRLSQHNVAIYLLHGNRDFLLGDGFSKHSNIQILPDPTLIECYGKSVLISHGDALCTDDIEYQKIRDEVRTEAWQAAFLSQPLSKRIEFIESVRARSNKEKAIKSMEIMDVNESAVAKLFKEHGYPPTLIHGHTHRPMVHQHIYDSRRCQRWVLGDWYDQGSYLRLDAKGIHEEKL